MNDKDLIQHFEYTELERNEIKQRVIDLESIGHAYDPASGFIYPLFADDSLDFDNFLTVQEIDKDNGISQKDWEIIKKV